MKTELTAFEKFLKGYKTYLVALAGIIYGVLELGFNQHHWTNVGGVWTWVFSASGVAAFRAAFATYAETLLTGLGITPATLVGASTVAPLPPTTVVPDITPTPTMSGVAELTASPVTDTSGQPVTDPNAAR